LKGCNIVNKVVLTYSTALVGFLREKCACVLRFYDGLLLQVDVICYIVCQCITYNSIYQQNVPVTQNLYLLWYVA